jgi:flagellar biosynthesis/type III secretory pathway M-ring protein FliF/YscJ
MMTKKIIIGLATVLIIIIALIYAVGRHQYKYVTSYSDSNYHYVCTKPLKASQQTIGFEGGNSRIYVPVDKSETTQYCKISGAY